MMLCYQTAYWCLCKLDDEHEGPHVCECGGSWNGEFGTDTFEPVRFPGVSDETDQFLKEIINETDN